jgi:hypothetical protein
MQGQPLPCTAYACMGRSRTLLSDFHLYLDERVHFIIGRSASHLRQEFTHCNQSLSSSSRTDFFASDIYSSADCHNKDYQRREAIEEKMLQ